MTVAPSTIAHSTIPSQKTSKDMDQHNTLDPEGAILTIREGLAAAHEFIADNRTEAFVAPAPSPSRFAEFNDKVVRTIRFERRAKKAALKPVNRIAKENAEAAELAEELNVPVDVVLKKRKLSKKEKQELDNGILPKGVDRQQIAFANGEKELWDKAAANKAKVRANKARFKITRSPRRPARHLLKLNCSPDSVI